MGQIEVYNLLINAGIAGVFAIFAIFVLREFIKYLEKQNDLWRSYLAGERTQRRETMEEAHKSMNSMALNLAELSKQIALLTQIVQRMESTNNAIQKREAKKVDVEKQTSHGS